MEVAEGFVAGSDGLDAYSMTLRGRPVETSARAAKFHRAQAKQHMSRVAQSRSHWPMAEEEAPAASAPAGGEVL